MARDEEIETAKVSVERLQTYDTKALGRAEDFGKAMNFEEVIPAAERLISLYKRLPISMLADLTSAQLQQILGVANADFNRFEEIRNFSAERQDANAERQRLIKSVVTAYDGTFTTLWQFMAYGLSRNADPIVLETQARATIQKIKDESGAASEALALHQKNASEILGNIQRTAAEAGVSQQAGFFKVEADAHDTAAATLRGEVIKRAWWVGGFAVLSIFLHKIPFFAPASGLEAAQLISSKILIFVVLGYLLVLTAKDYLSHKHNSIVNRHRQNALQTFRALADAAHERGAEDIVLAHAAACIFAPQDTGYAGHSEGGSSKSVLELLTKSSTKGDAAG